MSEYKDNLITKSDLNAAVWRSIVIQGTFNYERYQGSGWCAMIAPILEKIHSDNKNELRERLKDNSGFFNTQLIMANFLLGLVISLYEKKADRKLINGLRISLFGPLAGIGDSIFWFTLMPIMAGICSSLATKGNIIGPIIYFLVYIGVFALRFFAIRVGYYTGSKSIEKLGAKTGELSTAASILGCTVLGGLIATLVSFQTKATITITDSVSLSIQEAFFDQIIPNFLPVVITILMYVMLKKKVSPTFLILLLLIGSLTLSYFGMV
ncbi:PTS system mannose/fructose/sorbose family transporter subunit IID [Clostridiales bacterium COT073_COT-073]|nr:PTS system mannose/fructose/sorbose family transporter subunit IID [Clostridiales bacterium COT073_COT-073]